jgi:hypothetical protein
LPAHRLDRIERRGKSAALDDIRQVLKHIDAHPLPHLHQRSQAEDCG